MPLPISLGDERDGAVDRRGRVQVLHLASSWGEVYEESHGAPIWTGKEGGAPDSVQGPIGEEKGTRGQLPERSQGRRPSGAKKEDTSSFGAEFVQNLRQQLEGRVGPQEAMNGPILVQGVVCDGPEETGLCCCR